MAKKETAAKKPAGRKATNCELIDTGTGKRDVRRGAAGKFKKSDDVGESLTREYQDQSEIRLGRQGDR